MPLAPMVSALMLAGGVQLTVAELSASAAKSPELVFLSACESAMAGTRVPDEMLGFPAAFLGAGASAVIAGLWALPEDATAEIVEWFYRYWVDGGENAADALARAQTDLMRSGSPVVDWAGLTYTGQPLGATLA